MFEWPDNTCSLNDSLPFHYQTLPSLCPSPFVFVVHRNRNSVPKFCICFLLFLMMSATPQEIDYIGLSKTSASGSYSCLKTELSLCLPGSESPGSNQVLGLSLFGPESGQGFSKNGGRCKDFGGCGGKRGFADSSGKWGLSVNGGSEGEVGKGAALFSHGAGKCVDIGKKRGELKDMEIDEGTASQKSLQEKKSVNGPGSAPAAKAQVVGWPPIRSFRKNSMASATTTKNNSNEGDGKSGSTCLYVKVSMDGAPYLRKVDLKLYKNYRELSLALRIMFSCFPVGKDGDDLPSECVLTYEDKDGDWMLVGDVPWDMFTSTCKRMRIMK